MNNPSVSIALATYNGEKYLVKQLESLLSQTYQRLDVVICDDQSTDGTRTIIRNYIEKHPSTFTAVFNEENLGYVRNFEKAVSLCKGDYIALCDQDDIWDTDKISTLLKSIGTADMVHTDARLIDDEGNVIDASFSKRSRKRVRAHDFMELCVNNSVTGCTAFFRRTLLENALPFPEKVMHDHWLAMVAKDQGGLLYLDIPLISYRQHGSNSIGASCSPNKYADIPRKREEIYRDRLNRYLYLERIAIDRLSCKNACKISELRSYYESFFKKTFRPKSALFYCRYFRTLNSSNNSLRILLGFFRSLFGKKLVYPA